MHSRNHLENCWKKMKAKHKKSKVIFSKHPFAKCIIVTRSFYIDVLCFLSSIRCPSGVLLAFPAVRPFCLHETKTIDLYHGNIQMWSDVERAVSGHFKRYLCMTHVMYFNYQGLNFRLSTL